MAVHIVTGLSMSLFLIRLPNVEHLIVSILAISITIINILNIISLLHDK